VNEILKFFILGVIQGLTEFLPVSSSGHLNLVTRILKMHLGKGQIFLFVWLHLATLIALLCFFHKDIKFTLKKVNIFVNLIVATLVTGVLFLLIRNYIEEAFTNKYLTSLSFLLTSLLLVGIKGNRGGRDIDKINLKDSLAVGSAQTIALLPGVSRSGITIVTLIKRGIRPLEAFRFSFLMAIPIILGAFMMEFTHLKDSNFPLHSIIIGFISALVSGLVALKILKRVIINNHLHYFGYYCFFLFVISLII